MDYISPDCTANDTGFYILPPIDQILKDLRMCGGDTEAFLKKHISLRDHRAEVLHRILMTVEKDEAAQKEFEDIRSGARKMALLKAEDNMLKMSKLGTKDSFKATELLLTMFNDRWSKRAAPSPQQEKEKKVLDLVDDLENDDGD